MPDAQAIHARRVLAALDAGEYALGEDACEAGAAPGDGHAARADRAGDGEGALQPPYRESLSSRIAWAALMLFGLPLPWRRRPSDDGSAVRRV